VSATCNVEKPSPAVYQIPSGTNAGFVGIGTTSPAVNFHVVGSVATSGTGNIQIRASNLSTTGASISYVSAAANNEATVAVLGADGLGTGPLGAAGGFFGTFSNQPAGIVTNHLERMRVTSAGLVGIGTTSPMNILHVDGATPVLSTGSGAGLEFQDRSGGSSPETEWYGTGSVSRLWRSDVTTNHGSGSHSDVMGLSNNGVPGVLYTQPPDNVLLALSGAFAVQGPSPWIDVTLYGADPSGASDSTDQINNAINACPQVASGGNSNGCTVFFPPGIYRIAGGTKAIKGIQITQSNLGVKLMGAGAASATSPAAASELVNTMTGGNYVINVECISAGAVCMGSGISNVNGVIISNLGFLDSSSSPYLTGGAILLRDAQYFSIDGISCESFAHSACITMWGDTVSGTPVYTQFGSIKDLFSQGLYGITTAVPNSSGNPSPIVSEGTLLGGNISCLGAGGVFSNSIGVDFDGTYGHNGENQIFGTAVNDCTIGYQLNNTGATHLVGKFECDSAGMTNCGSYGLLMDNPDSTSGHNYSDGNALTLQVSKASIGIQINDSGGTATAPAKEQVVGSAFHQNQAADICVNSTSLTTAMILVAQAGLGTLGTGCTSGTLVTGSQFATGVGLPSSNSSGAVMVTWAAGSSAPSASTCTTATLGSLFSDSATSTMTGPVPALYVCQESSGTPTWLPK